MGKDLKKIEKSSERKDPVKSILKKENEKEKVEEPQPKSLSEVKPSCI